MARKRLVLRLFLVVLVIASSLLNASVGSAASIGPIVPMSATNGRPAY